MRLGAQPQPTVILLVTFSCKGIPWRPYPIFTARKPLYTGWEEHKSYERRFGVVGFCLIWWFRRRDQLALASSNWHRI